MATHRPHWQDYTSAIVSGFLGDWLEQRGNRLAVDMQFIHNRQPLTAVPADASDTVFLLIHGLTELESIWDYPHQPGSHYGTELADACNGTPLLMRYNTGRPIYRNGLDLSEQLETLLSQWPVPVKRLVLVGHSMGGLVIRSACHYGQLAQHRWIESVCSCVYLGSPHQGSWLARLAHHGSALMQQMPRDYLRVVGDVLELRSEGIRNLTHGEIIEQQQAIPPLLASAKHFAASGLLIKQRENPINWLFGDALVQEHSARCTNLPGWSLQDHACFPGIDHIRLTHHPDVAQQLRSWLL